jgi:hypothetical protein
MGNVLVVNFAYSLTPPAPPACMLPQAAAEKSLFAYELVPTY